MALDDEELEQISKMLERGGKMLAAHCEQCQSPLFKYEGKTTCPVCEYRAVQKPPQPSPQASETPSSQATPSVAQGTGQKVPFDELILQTVSNVALKMSTETDLARIQTQLECIERGLRILQLIRATGL
ncbi:MAG: Sjogren's syndrome/scleroderma autoantigen 1 family protein [Halobacteriota archaeon]